MSPFCYARYEDSAAVEAIVAYASGSSGPVISTDVHGEHAGRRARKVRAPHLAVPGEGEWPK